MAGCSVRACLFEAMEKKIREMFQPKSVNDFLLSPAGEMLQRQRRAFASQKRPVHAERQGQQDMLLFLVVERTKP